MPTTLEEVVLKEWTETAFHNWYSITNQGRALGRATGRKDQDYLGIHSNRP